MTSLLTAHNLSKSYASQELFTDISFTISEGNRIGLLGPNGSGKTTLLRILAGVETPDSGYVSRRQGLRIGYAAQAPEFPSKSLEEVLMDSLPHADEVESSSKARMLLSKALFTDFLQNASVLSGGWKKRLDIVRSLMNDPDLLLLDEPTNHLDLEGILWLEKFLLKEKIPFFVISHDRYFLENVTNKVFELNKCFPDGLFASDGAMSDFLEHKEAFLQGQLEQQRSLSATVRDEIDWLRRSPKARTTKSRSRIQRAHKLISELSDVSSRNKTPKVGISFSASERETRKLITTKNLTKSYGGKTLFKGIDLTLSPGTRLGIVGKNGTGKTTLLKILAGEESQDVGTIKYAEDLQLVYFDQHREHLPPDITLKEALSPSGDMVDYRGNWIHVNGWAKKFLFPPERLSLPIKCLSGGERARILIARLMLKPADVLFLDEPTNDLDIPTLEIMEESLIEFTGAVVLISHDRCLMDRVCTQILGLGIEKEDPFFADYSQWEKALAEVPIKKELPSKPATSAASRKEPSKKLTYLEKKELDAMEQSILETEQEIARHQKLIDDPSVVADTQKSLETYRLLGEAHQKLEKLFERWQYLEEKSQS